MKNIEYYLLFGIVVVASIVRFYGFTHPVADWHSWRQSDTAAVARNFLKFGFDPLRPRFDDLSNIPSGHDNPMGWRMVEFPLYQLISAGLFRAFWTFSIEEWLRIVSIAASAGSIVLIGLIVKQVSDKTSGFLAALVYAFLPYNIYFGRTILPDTQMVFWSLFAIYLMMRANSTQTKKCFVLMTFSAAAAALALLTKPVAGFLLLPIGYLFLKRRPVTFVLIGELVLYAIISVVPLMVWRKWILQYPEGIAVYTWLFNEGNIRFKGAWWYWLFSQRIGNIMLGYWGLIPFGLGLIVAATKKEGWFFRWWAIGAIAYLVIIARGNVQHDYYQILISPIVCIYVAHGVVYLLRIKNDSFSTIGRWLLVGFSLLLGFAFSWYTMRTYYWINRQEIVDVGNIADQLLPKNAKVIAPYNGDTTFLYQINRQGWPIGFDIDKKIAMGATHYVTLSPNDSDLETRDLAQLYTVLVRNEKYAIIDLTKPTVTPPK